MIDVGSLVGEMGGNIAPSVLTVLILIIGLLALLYGYRLFHLFMFLAGFAVGTFVIGLFAKMPIAILGGLVVGVLCCALWSIGLFVFGSLIGMVGAVALGVREQVLVCCIALLFGVLAIAIQKFMIIVSTSFFGASMVAPLIARLLGSHNMLEELVIIMVISVIGIVCQYTLTSGKKAKPMPAENAQAPDEPVKPIDVPK